MDLLSHGVDQVGTGFILAEVIEIHLCFVDDSEEVLVVYCGVERSGVLLDDGENTCWGKGVFGDVEESVYEVFLTENALLVVVEAFELVGEL